MTPGGARFRTGVNLHRGANGQPPPLLRDWQRNMSSMSVSRHLQHLAMWRFVDTYGPRFNHRSRCLDWDGWYVGSIFATICTEKDVIQYTTSEPQEVKPKKLIWTASGANPWATRWYMADAHSMSRTLQRGAYDLIIANSVFEHFRQPFAVMQEIFVLLRPGGFLFWHTPFEYEFHGVPNDYFRFTTSGARAIAESAGLEVEFAEGDGGFVAVLSNLVGLGSHCTDTAAGASAYLWRYQQDQVQPVGVSLGKFSRPNRRREIPPLPDNPVCDGICRHGAANVVGTAQRTFGRLAH